MSEFVPIYLTDKSTFCTYIYNACVAQGKTPVAAKRDFVNDCANRYPTTIKEDFVLKGTKYRWEFNSDYATAPKYGVSPSRNFMVWEKIDPKLTRTPSGNGQSILQKVADRQTDKCDKFGGGPGATSETVKAGAGSHARGHLLAPVERETLALDPIAVDLPGNGYPDATLLPGYRLTTSDTPFTWTHVVNTMSGAQEKIAFGAAVVASAILFFVARGTLPPLESPATPPLSPFLDHSGRNPLQI